VCADLTSEKCITGLCSKNKHENIKRILKITKESSQMHHHVESLSKTLLNLKIDRRVSSTCIKLGEFSKISATNATFMLTEFVDFPLFETLFYSVVLMVFRIGATRCHRSEKKQQRKTKQTIFSFDVFVSMGNRDRD
jgi:hypothetical protein